VMQAVIGVKFIADHMKQQDEESLVSFSLLIPTFSLSVSVSVSLSLSLSLSLAYGVLEM